MINSLKPIGFTDKPSPKPIYFKNDILGYLLSQNNNDEIIVQDLYNKYWLNNEDIIIAIKNSQEEITDIPIEKETNPENTIEEMRKIIDFFSKETD